VVLGRNVIAEASLIGRPAERAGKMARSHCKRPNTSRPHRQSNVDKYEGLVGMRALLPQLGLGFLRHGPRRVDMARGHRHVGTRCANRRMPVDVYRMPRPAR